MRIAVFVLCFSVAWALPWRPASLNLRRVIGAYNLVSREYAGQLTPYALVRAYSKVSLWCPWT